MTHIAAFNLLAGRPAGFFGINFHHAALEAGLIANGVEDEEFILRAKVGGVGDAGTLQVSLGALGDRARITNIALHAVGLDHVAGQADGGLFKERIDEGAFRVRHQDHVGFIDALPAGDA